MTKSRDLANAATALNAVTATELGFVDGVTSAIQTQIDTKLATATAATTYVANSLADAKGDIFVATADNTLTRLPVGNSGEQIVADSSASTGLRWQGSAIGKNAAINGACEIAQRGTAAVTLTAASFLYPVDRFFAFRSAGLTGATAQQITSTGLDGFQYAVRVQRTAANTSTNDIGIGQSFETSNSIPFANKTVVVSFWARAGANYSPTSSALSVRLYTGTGTDQSGFGSSFTGTATPISQIATLTTSWQRFQYTATLAATTTQVQFLTFATPTGTAGAADYYDITGLQVELGSIATPFSRSQGTIQGELAACQRYYYRSTATGSYSYLGRGIAASGTAGYYDCLVPVQMRVFPTSVDFSTLGVTLGPGTAIYAISAVSLNASTVTAINVSVTNSASGYAAGSTSTISTNGSTAGYIGFSAEL